VKFSAKAGYDETAICRVQELNLKKNFPDDPEARVLEDALCLVFLEFNSPASPPGPPRIKSINALQKSWQKIPKPPAPRR